jgi:polyisoprenyl-teichoic acid--peptidoglycan teichoic acid transferase
MVMDNKSQFVSDNKKRFYQKKWFKVFSFLVLLGVIVGGVMAWKAGGTLNKITKGGLFNSIVHVIPGVSNELKGEKDDRINILLLGMRGENVPGGGTLADTIMVASIEPKANKIAMISIPRDLYVDNPVWGNKTKINAVYAAGEENGKKQGLEEMEKVIGDLSGLQINYGVSTNFEGFKQLVNAIEGVEITLDKPFEEPVQFNEPHVCDPYVFTVPTGQYQIKTKTNKITGVKRVTKKYPLCTNPNTECGGDFKLPSGKQTLSGDQALCYVRSRATTSDFERAKRQQLIIQLIKDKLLSAGTLTDFNKLDGIMNSLGDNVRSDFQPWEMKKMYDLYMGMQNPQVYQRVLENSDEGLLYNPPETPGAGYILLPIGDNYDKIRDMFKNIFEKPAQSDIKPR